MQSYTITIGGVTVTAQYTADTAKRLGLTAAPAGAPAPKTRTTRAKKAKPDDDTADTPTNASPDTGE